jgi:type I restriction-modification system DNA methylase subunit
MTAPESAYTEIEKLVKTFKGMPAAQRKGLNEMQTRLGYILPLFRALGWDINNINEVSPEEKVSRGWVDFSFRIGNRPRFFLETKRVNEDLNDPRWVKQAIDYAWTKSVTWALLSDFEGLRVFNAEWKQSDPFRAQFFAFDLDSYLTDFNRLWWLSKEETLKRRLDQEAEKDGKKVKRQPVSQHLFDDLKRWRENLFKNYKAFNPVYSAAQIDEAVLRLLNRLIFIRTAEDREVEDNRLRSLVRGLEDRKQINSLDRALTALFWQLDVTYNSELFARHFSEELQIPPSDLEDVIEGLYEKNYVRYNFNALDADVLGTAYEQYLGHVIAEGEAQVHIEEKRTKRKSQGIYYTPTFVTKYIVQQTVGKYLEKQGYSPSQPPRVLDMACGSGSFLIEAFDVIDTFVARQRGHAKHGQVDFFDRVRQLEVLQNCIFGVDKDKQAVEVARLNLLLRALHSREKLPMLENIQHGDSLRQETWDNMMKTLKVFAKHSPNETLGPETFRVSNEGSFDIIIGNPPYVRQETLGEEFKAYAKSNFETYAGTADLYIYFIEQAHKLLKPNGYFGMIVSNKWMRSNYGKALREFLKRESQLLEIIDFGELPVFGDVLAYPVIVVSRRKQTQKQNFLYAAVRTLDFDSLTEEIKSSATNLDEKVLNGDGWSLAAENSQGILDKLRDKSVSLGEFVKNQIYYGIKTGCNEAFIIQKDTRDRLIASDSKSAEIIKPFLMGRDVHEYRIEFDERYLIFTRRGIDMTKYAAVHRFLQQFQERLAPRPRDWKGPGWPGRKPGSYQWYEIQDPLDYYAEFERQKIILPAIVQRATFALDRAGYYSNDKTTIIASDDLFLLGILNSRISDYVLRQIASTKQGGYFEQKPMYISQLPIRRIDLANPAETSAHDEIVRMVEWMLALQKERQLVRPEEDFDRVRNLEREILRVDQEIDQRVYELYGLTDEEIRIVAGK